MILFVTLWRKERLLWSLKPEITQKKNVLHFYSLPVFFYLLSENNLKYRELIGICKETPTLENTSIYFNFVFALELLLHVCVCICSKIPSQLLNYTGGLLSMSESYTYNNMSFITSLGLG